MSRIPTSLRVAIAFVAALWVVGLMALVSGAPGEIVMAAAAIGTIGALVELTSDRWDSPEGLPDDATTIAASAAGELQSEPAPQSGAIPIITGPGGDGYRSAQRILRPRSAATVSKALFRAIFPKTLSFLAGSNAAVH